MTPTQIKQAIALLAYREELGNDIKRAERFKLDREAGDDDKIGLVVLRGCHMTARIPEDEVVNFLRDQLNTTNAKLEKMGVKL